MTSGGMTMEEAAKLQTFKRPQTPDEKRRFIEDMVVLVALDGAMADVVTKALIDVFLSPNPPAPTADTGRYYNGCYGDGR